MQKLAALGGALCLLTIALMSSAWVHRQAEAGLAEIQGELALAVDAEIEQAGDGQSPAQATPPLPNSTGWDFSSADSPGSLSREKVISREVQVLQHDVAALLVVTEANPVAGGQPTVYRQMRFYRQTEQGWQPTSPIPSLWGQLQHLETEHFDITYRSRDAQAVQAVATEMDALYEKIRNHMGLSSYLPWHVGHSIVPERKIAIDVVVEKPGDRQTYARREQITVSSPVLMRAPESLTDAAILRQSILLHLVDKAISEAVSTHRVPPHWHRLLSAMHLWQTWDLGGPLAAWREPALHWLSGDPRWTDDASPLSEKYVDLCVQNKIWQDTVLQTPLPLLCSGMDKATLNSWDLFSSRRPFEFKELIRIPSYQLLMTDYSSELTYPTYPPSQMSGY